MNAYSKIDNALQTRARFAELSDSAKAMVQILAARYCAAAIGPEDNAQHFGEHRMLGLHHVMIEESSAQCFFHSGGGIFLSQTVHVDNASRARVFVQCSDEGMMIYFLGDEFADTSDAEEIGGHIWELCGDDEHLQIAVVWPWSGNNGRVSDACKVYAAAGNLEMAANLLNAALLRKYRAPIESGQCDALRDGSESFGMLDDMEARMQIDVTQARCYVINAHLLLGECAPDIAKTIHEVSLSHEYGQTMSAFGLAEFSSADEMTHGMRGLGEECCDYTREFIERWDSEVSGIDAPYIPGTIDGARESDLSEEEAELFDELAELEEAIETLHASQRDAFARLSGEMSDVRARLRALRMGDEK